MVAIFNPEIILSGLAPVAQPLDKVINKVFKGHFRGLYDLYILTMPIRKLEILMHPEKDLTCSNEGTMVVFTHKEVETMVEDICGKCTP